jgi:voltage-gated sodium channel
MNGFETSPGPVLPQPEPEDIKSVEKIHSRDQSEGADGNGVAGHASKGVHFGAEVADNERMSPRQNDQPKINHQMSTEELIHSVLNKMEDPAPEFSHAAQKCGHRVYNTDWFHNSVSLVILINAIYIGVETNHPQMSQSVNGQQPTHVWETFLAEVFFQTFFTIELAFKFLALGCSAFHDALTTFDLILVGIGFVDIAATLYSFTEDGRHTTDDLTFFLSLRVLRIVRISRVLRLLRLLRVFKELWLMIAGIMGSLRTILWAWALIVLIIYVFAIVGVRLVGRGDDHSLPWVQEYFGGVMLGMFTYFQIMTLEGWADIARPLVGLDDEFRSTSGHLFYPSMVACILLFMSITTFAIMNVVVAVIVENTLDQAVLKRDNAMQKIRREQKEAIQKAYEIFNACDANGDGSLTQDEFTGALKDQQVQQYLHEVGIHISDAEGLFDILDHDQSGRLSVHEFVDGCIRARGGARAKEMMMLHCDIFKMFKKVKRDILALGPEDLTVKRDILALQAGSPGGAVHPWRDASDGAESNAEKSAPWPETPRDPASQTELRTRVESSIQRTESTLSEVKRRVNKELGALEERIWSSSRSSGAPRKTWPTAEHRVSNSKDSLAMPGTPPNGPMGDQLQLGRQTEADVEDLIRGSKTLDDLLDDVEADLTRAGELERPPAR